MKAAAPQCSRRPAARAARIVFAALAGALCLAAATRAQTVTATDSAPPRKDLPEDVRAQLSGAKNIKDRVKLSLQFAEGKIQLANWHTEAGRYIEAGNQLGIYQAIVEDLLTSVHRHGGSRGDKMRDTFKRIEMSLRAHVPRLETLRRITPSEEAVHIRSCIEFVRDARTRALESFYDDTVLRHPPDEPKGKEMKDGSARHNNTPHDEPEKKPERR